MITFKEVLGFQAKNEISDLHILTDEVPCMRSNGGEIIQLDNKVLTKEEMDIFLSEAFSEEEMEIVKKDKGGDFGKTFKGVEGRFNKWIK